MLNTLKTDYLKKYAGKEYTNVGSLKEPDFEAIHAMKPDVIFISARQAELYDQFAEIAPTIFGTTPITWDLLKRT